MQTQQSSLPVQVIVPTKDTSKVRDFTIEKENAAPLDLKFLECRDDFNSLTKVGAGAEVLYVRGIPVDAHTIRSLPSCKLIVTGSVGMDHIDVQAANECRIAVVNVPDVFTNEVAEHAIALILSAHRELRQLDFVTREGLWQQGHKLCSQLTPLSEATLGLVGFGRIARSVAKRIAPMCGKLIAVDPNVPVSTFLEFGVESVDLSTLAKRSDIVSLHLPHGDETHQLIDDQFFLMMNETAVLVNTGRGSTIDEAALLFALQSNRIRGAALDVFEDEPIALDNGLLGCRNLTLTPHVASITDRFEPSRKARIGQEIRAYFSGNRPRSCINWHEIAR